MRHYLMVTRDHFDAAVSEPAKKVAQIPAQQAHAEGCNESHAFTLAHEKTPVLPGLILLLKANCLQLTAAITLP